MKKRVLAAVLAASMMMSLTACGSSSNEEASSGSSTAAASEEKTEAASTEEVASTSAEGTETAAADEDYSDLTIAIILKTLSSEYWGYVEAGIKAAEAELGCTVDLQGPPSETSYDEQQNMIETTLARTDVDALAIAPLQADLVANLVADADIPILAVDTRIEGADNVLTFVGTDHETAAHDGAYEICSEYTDGAKVAFIEGVQGDATNTSRFKGFEDGAVEAGAEVMETQYCDAADDKARTAMDAIISKYPNEGDLDIVFCCNDSCAQAAAKALSEVNRTDIKICGYDGISSGVQAIIDGTMAASVAQDPYNIGYQCVLAACQAAKGETIAEEIDTGSHLITSDNAEEYLATLNEYLGK